MNADVEFHIRHNYPWTKLPLNIKQVLGNSQKEYDKEVVKYSIKNQLRFKGNLVKTIRKDERKYYEQLLQYSRDHLMLFPYHLSDVIVKGLRMTPFAYYISIMTDIMTQEKSYDSLPNFTAADCLRLLGIGRNQYIELMNQCRSSKKFFRKKSAKDLVPLQPIDINIEPWWTVQAGYITEEDVKTCSQVMKEAIDFIIDGGGQQAGTMECKTIHKLYKKGLIYLDCPIADDDCFIVPPLEGFVMNRVLGDYLETLLYKIFVSIDEHTSVAELANVLQIDLPLVKNAVSMYCRLGFAKKKNPDLPEELMDPSWQEADRPKRSTGTEEKMLIDWSSAINEQQPPSETSSTTSLEGGIDANSLMNAGHSKRIGFLFDSTLTAFLMMGNLSPGLKSHAVTMFEVGKLNDESLDSFLSELDKVNASAEGEAQRYFDHAVTLRDTIKFLRYNKELSPDPEFGSMGLDLIRCESLLGLDPGTCSRVLNKNYSLLVSMAPLSNEIRPISSCSPQHIGPAIPEVNSVWFKLFLYHITGCGPPSLLLVKGTRLKRLPKVFQEYDRLLVTTWGHDPGVLATSNLLLTLNDALTHSAVLIQAHGWLDEGMTVHVPFPLEKEGKRGLFSKENVEAHFAVQELASKIDLSHSCGYVTLLKTGKPEKTGADLKTKAQHVEQDGPENGIKDSSAADTLAFELDSLGNESSDTRKEEQLTLDLNATLDGSNTAEHFGDENDWMILDCCFGLPLFDSQVNKDVCARIIEHAICDPNNLTQLLHSSRKLSLQLLSFINEYQDSLTDNGDSGLTKQEHSPVPQPTNCLLFLDGNLSTWELGQ
ncbi:protein FAM91A1 [Lingula anatina]|uniref:Protein FAM91A1 n=1 Tax=Lingula anatina TaxID=7574 RepID=A0A1S3ITA9_LINAN|nr:protein FAM91A1 [Lingula anatina]|eukprot:XP_013401437.1 protein FAM91A1 [Lingula anatina]